MKAELASNVEFQAEQWKRRLLDEDEDRALTVSDLKALLTLIVNLAAAVHETE